MEPLLVAVATLGLFIFGGHATYTISERRHRHRWQRFEQQPVAKENLGPFRQFAGAPATKTVLTQRRAPKTIRRTALWSIYMGQMAVPGGLLGLFGLLACGIGLVSIPGMILAVRIWRLGYAMLRRDRGAAEEARSLARFALYLNTTLIAVGAVLSLIDPVFLGVEAVLIVYGAVSFAHAQAMQRCGDLLELEDRMRNHGEQARYHAPEEIVVAARVSTFDC